MGLKKRSKVSAEFSMSSLTDIIFLLLIFFMLTSTLVRIQPFELPKSDSKTVASTSIVVTLEKNGRTTVNNNETAARNLERALRMEVRTSDNRDNAAITIVAEIGTPFDRVVEVMEIANRLKVNAIIATEPRS
ncbi:ExbD/TolR family protein [Phaeodactylibacter xiamenensis]|jgi:biopolymer transport protein ExbD|uniref:Biopolymer transporter ExbD n=1 Tax=Phaeodactylibacter xiamenensis TaxID=1524460 RepID=A0A098SCN2_9BACT|nr:biopolymer transporter ExbD [Phaeodactylibacter xiamenensis]KGE89850.1 biopolymer transporter ExbD [Phaeodactylibacter xiamenensis]MCR9054988.1 biopolymer transporter ExbD [bacterium]